MKVKPTLSVKRGVEIFEEAVSVRRELYDDSDFFRMTDFWEELCGESGLWKIKRYRSSETEDFKRKAGVIAFADRATLTVDQKLWDGAKQGRLFYNFVLAHELGHLIVNHHARSAVTKNFQLFGPDGRSNIPPTVEELEANYAAVFVQCGVALLNPKWETLQLALRAFSDPLYVKKAQMAVRVDEFRRLLNRPKTSTATVTGSAVM